MKKVIERYLKYMELELLNYRMKTRKYWEKLLSRTVKSNLKNFYLSVHDISAYNWNEVYNKGELQYLHKELAFTSIEEMQKVHKMVFDSYIREFGLSDEAKHELDQQKIAHDLYCKFITTKDFRFKRKADIIISKLEMKKENKVDSDDYSFSKQITIVGKYYGRPVNPREISAYNFFAAIKTMVEDASN